MQQPIHIILAVCLFLLSACSHESEPERVPVADETTVGFTAMAGKEETKATNSPLTDNAKVTVYAWTGALLSTASGAPVHTNSYTVTNSLGASLTPVGAAMKAQLGVPYFFYALSTNSDAAVPVLKGNYTTVSLANGIDYLMAASTNGNSGYTFTASDTESKRTVPLSFRHLATRIELTVQPATTDGYTSADALSVGIASIDSTDSYIDLSASKILWPASGENPLEGGIPLDRPDGQPKKAQKDGTAQTKFTVSFILLPVYSAEQGIPLQLDFTGMKFQADDAGTAKSYTGQLKGSGTNALELKGGNTYSFDVRISRYSATFSIPKVIPWEITEMDVDNMEEETTT